MAASLIAEALRTPCGNVSVARRLEPGCGLPGNKTPAAASQAPRWQKRPRVGVAGCVGAEFKRTEGAELRRKRTNNTEVLCVPQHRVCDLTVNKEPKKIDARHTQNTRPKARLTLPTSGSLRAGSEVALGIWLSRQEFRVHKAM